MAACDLCLTDMLLGTSCQVAAFASRAGVEIEAVRFAPPLQTLHSAAGACCPDCWVKPGGYHHAHCARATCPACHGQLLSCGCNITPLVPSVLERRRARVRTRRTPPRRAFHAHRRFDP
jgi:hypothetical protein